MNEGLPILPKLRERIAFRDASELYLEEILEHKIENLWKVVKLFLKKVVNQNGVCPRR